MSDIAEAIRNLTRVLNQRIIRARWGKGGMDEAEKREVAEAMSELSRTFDSLGLSEKEDGHGD